MFQRSGGLAERLCRPVVFALLLVGLGLAVSVWFARFHVPPSDAGALLTSASKILRGAVFYRDIDAYPLPGASYLLAFAMWLFGEHLSVARGLAAAVYGGILLGLYAIALQLLEPRRAALFGLSLLGFKFLAWPALTSYMYWDVSLCFGVAGAALLLANGARGPSWRLVAAGACVALAILCKQNLGIYLAAAALLLICLPAAVSWTERLDARRRWSELAAFSLGMALPTLPVALYFGLQGALPQLAYSGFIRPFTAYASTSGMSFLEPLEWWSFGALRESHSSYMSLPYWWMLMRNELPGPQWYDVYWGAGEFVSRLIYTSIPLAFFGALLVRLRSPRLRRAPRDGRLCAFSLLAAAIVMSAFPRADFTHVIGVYPLVLLLLFALWDRAASRAGENRLAAWARKMEPVAVIALLAVLGVLSVVHHAHLTRRMVLEKADLYVYPDSWVESVVRFISDETAPGDPLFVYGNDAYYYFLSGRFSPWPFSQLYPGQAGGDQGRALVTLLRRDPPRFIVRGMGGWPGLPEISSYAPFLYRYVIAHYRPDERVFERHPLPAGESPPTSLVISVLKHAGRE